MLGAILGLFNKFVPDADARKKFEKEMKVEYEKTFQLALKADKEVKLAELKKGGIAAIWRPLSAISIFLTLFLYHFIYPLCWIVISLFNLDVYLIELDPLPLEYYGLAVAFVSIYAHGRSMEKQLRKD